MDIFISYAEPDKEVAENLHSRFNEYYVKTWAYCRDKIPGVVTWNGIEEGLKSAKLILWLCSHNSKKSQGQLKELDIWNAANSKQKPTLIPVLLEKTVKEDLPKVIRCLNYEKLEMYNFGSFALRITKKFFSGKAEKFVSNSWFYPRPSDWLEIIDFYGDMERHFELGDQVYFRKISPVGLFECYSPKLKELYWLPSDTVKIVNLSDEERDSKESEIRQEFSILAMIDAEATGFQIIRKFYKY